jgi:hypothetical protein
VFACLCLEFQFIVVFLFSLLEEHILVVDVASKEITHKINGLINCMLFHL